MYDFITSFGIQTLLAVVLDIFFIRIQRWRPLEKFEELARRIEGLFYLKDDDGHPERQFPYGVIAVLFTAIPLVIVTWLLTTTPILGWWFEVGILYVVIRGSQLAEDARIICRALFQGSLPEARKQGKEIAREISIESTDNMTKEQMVTSTTKWVLKTGNSAVFGALFWFAVAGAPAALLYRLMYRLNLLWDYRQEDYLFFGRFTAYFYCFLNIIPARITAFIYSLQGDWREALHCWQTQALPFRKRNNGTVVAAGAGALGFSLPGEETLGRGQTAEIIDIERSISLITFGTWYWVGIVLVFSLFI